MNYSTLFTSFFIGVVLWFFYYGFELAINGAFAYLKHSPLVTLIICAWQELTWILPGGHKRKLEFCRGNVDWANELPGLPHFIFTHIMIPWAPLAIHCGWNWL
jgi:hypothetical protein